MAITRRNRIEQFCFPCAAMLVAVACLAAPSTVRASELTPEFSLGLGYTFIEFEKSSDILGDQDGLRFDPYVSISPLPAVPQLRTGIGLGFSLALDETNGAAISGDDGLTVVGESDIMLALFEPELRLSWRQPLGADELWFIEIGGAVGGTFGWLEVDAEEDDDDADDDDDDGDAFTEHAASPHTRAFLRIGGFAPVGLVGIEASYLRAGDLDFTHDVGGELQQFYIGIFGALQF